MIPPLQEKAPVEELWREFSGPILGYLRNQAASAADADDLLPD